MVDQKRRGRPPGSIARYSVISEDIARRLAAGEWPVGTTLPSCRQFGRQYAVGAHVINRALRALETDGRVVISPRKLPVAALGARLESVVQNAVAVVLRSDIHASFDAPASHDIRTGFERVLGQRGCPPLLYLHHSSRWRTEFPIGLRDLPLKGILLYGPFSTEMLKRYENLDVPVVLIDQPAEQCALHTVTANNVDAAFDATMRLINLGHRRLAFIRSIVSSLRMIDPDARERQEGFTKACQAAGLAEDDYKIFTAANTPTSAATQSLVRAVPRYTGVLTANDHHAAQTLAAAESIGLRVPRDLSIAVFRAAHTARRNWSGAQIDFEGIGRAAAQLLDRKNTTPQRVLIPCSWVAGDSVARCRK